MDDGGRRKRPKSAKVDRISSLPEEILSLILSFLPTKSAVATSILSNRWKYVWTFITSLDFKAPNHNNHNFTYSTSERHFRKFVDHVFHCCNSPRIDKLVLHLYPNDLGKRSPIWVDEAIKRNVTELDISVCELPLSVFTCRTLTVLRLCTYDYKDYTQSVSFDLPCLKVLSIKWDGRLLHGFMEKLISSCPILEHLILGASLSYSRYTFKVSSSTLKTLDLQPSPRIWFPPAGDISVEAPNLEYLHLNESFINYNIKGDFSLLGRGSLNIGSNFRGIPSRFKLPIFFSNLTCLEFITCDKRFWEMLPKLIRSTPRLEVLSLEQYKGHDLYYTWVEPKSAAKCLGHHLEVIQIKGFKGRKHELQLVKYFLGSVKVLRTLTINCQGLNRGEEIYFFGEVLKFSRASKCCEVQFHGDLISNL